MQASSPEGDSDWSNTEQVTVMFAPPPAPTLEPIRNVDGDAAYLVDWDGVRGACGDVHSPGWTTTRVLLTCDPYTGTDTQYR